MPVGMVSCHLARRRPSTWCFVVPPTGFEPAAFGTGMRLNGQLPALMANVNHAGQGVHWVLAGCRGWHDLARGRHEVAATWHGALHSQAWQQ